MKSIQGLWARFWRLIKKRWWIIVLLVIGGLIAYNWWSGKNKALEEIETTTVERRDLQKTLEFSGEIDAHERASLRFAGVGKLVYLGAKEGDLVKKGQTIASLDRRTAQKTLEKTLNVYDSERAGYENVVDTRENRVLSEEEKRLAQQDQNSLEQTVLDVELQNLVIEQYVISAPFAGMLVSSPVSTTGINVSATDTFVVVNPSTLFFPIFVDEVDIDQIKPGQIAEIRLDAFPDMLLRATVDKIAYQSSQNESGTVFEVQLKFLDTVTIETQRLGMNGEAAIILEEKDDVVAVSLDAVKTRDGKKYVQQMENDQPVEKEIQTGLETQDYVEVTSGLEVGDAVVLP